MGGDRVSCPVFSSQKPLVAYSKGEVFKTSPLLVSSNMEPCHPMIPSRALLYDFALPNNCHYYLSIPFSGKGAQVTFVRGDASPLPYLPQGVQRYVCQDSLTNPSNELRHVSPELFQALLGDVEALPYFLESQVPALLAARGDQSISMATAKVTLPTPKEIRVPSEDWNPFQNQVLNLLKALSLEGVSVPEIDAVEESLAEQLGVSLGVVDAVNGFVVVVPK